MKPSTQEQAAPADDAELPSASAAGTMAAVRPTTGSLLLRADFRTAGADTDVVLCGAGRQWSRRSLADVTNGPALSSLAEYSPASSSDADLAVIAALADAGRGSSHAQSTRTLQELAATSHLAGVGVRSTLLLGDARLEPLVRLACGAVCLGGSVHALTTWNVDSAVAAFERGARTLGLTSAMVSELSDRAPHVLAGADAVLLVMSRRECKLPRGAPGKKTWPLDLKDLTVRTEIARPLPDAIRPGTFFAWAHHRPERPAILSDATAYTFGDIAQCAARFAEALRGAGFERDHVFVASPADHRDFLAAYFAALQLDGAVAVVGRAAPPADVERLHRALRPSHAVDRAPQGRGGHDRFVVTRLPGARRCGARGLIPRTAGTTGAGKWIVVTLEDEGADSNARMRALAQFAQITDGAPDRAHLVAGDIHHGAFFSQALAHLNNGSTLVVASRWHPREVVALAQRHGVQSTFLTPRMLGDLLSTREGRRLLAGLASLVYGGDSCPVGWKREVAALLPERSHEYYGASEALGTLRLGTDHDVDIASVGFPYVGAAFRVVDDAGEPVEPGEEGDVELWSPAGFSYVDGDDTQRHVGWVRLGDRGHVDSCGSLHITGRDAAMLRAGGRKLHATEVENALLEHEAIADAAVAVVEGPSLAALVALIVPKAGRAAPSTEELRLHCRASLPKWKVPSRFHVVDSIPQTGAGKVDRQALPALLRQPRGPSSEGPGVAAIPPEVVLALQLDDVPALPVAGGRVSTVWRSQRDGRPVAVRRSPPWRTWEEVAFEWQVLRRLSDLGARVPRALGEPVPLDGFVWGAFEWAEGSHPLTPVDDPATYGRLLASLHNLAAPIADELGQRPRWGRIDEFLTFLVGDSGTTLEAVLPDFARAFGSRGRALADTALAVHERLATRGLGDRPLTVAHGDFGPHQVLVDPHGEVTAVLDWDFSHVDLPAADLGVGSTLARPSVERAAAMLKGYLGVRDLDPGDLELLGDFRRAFHLNSLAGHVCGRWLKGVDISDAVAVLTDRLDREHWWGPMLLAATRDDPPVAHCHRPAARPIVDSSLTDLEVAHTLADRAASVAMHYFAEGVDAEMKSDATPVTVADRAVEAVLRESLAELRPEDAVLGEELGGSGESGRVWIIDPIDGTRLFASGDPGWRVQIALECDGTITVAVVDSPALGQRWWASTGGGAFQGPSSGLDGPTKRLHVSERVALTGARVTAYPPDAERRLPEATVQPTPTRLPLIDLLRGEIDAYFVDGCDSWDHAPWILLIQEAGGRFSDHDGGTAHDRHGGLYSNGHLHEALLDVLLPRGDR